MITKNEVDPKYIIKLVTEHYMVSIDELHMKVRYQPVARARQVAMYLVGLYTERTLEEIGMLFNRRKPATVSHAFTEIGTLQLIDAKLTEDVKHLRSIIEGYDVARG